MAPHVKAIWAFHPAVILSIIVFQVLVYRHARRHEQQILAQQVSLDARAKFKKEKKALKLTAKILVAVVGCYVPLMIFTLAGMIFANGMSADFQTAGRHLVLLPPILNSVINPIIYTVKNKQFRVAFIEILWRKSFQEAEALEKSLFGSRNNPVRPGVGRDSGGQPGQNSQGINIIQAKNPEEEAKVIPCAANLGERNISAVRNATPTALSSEEEEQGREGEEPEQATDGKNPDQANDNQEEDPEDITYAANFDDSNITAPEKAALNTHSRAEEPQMKQNGERPKHFRNGNYPDRVNGNQEEDIKDIVCASISNNSNITAPEKATLNTHSSEEQPPVPYVANFDSSNIVSTENIG